MTACTATSWGAPWPAPQTGARLYAGLIRQQDTAQLWQGLRNQVFLGDEAFVQRMRDAHTPPPAHAKGRTGVPRALRQRPASSQQLDRLLQEGPNRDQALHTAYVLHGHTRPALALATGLLVSRISRIIARLEGELKRGAGAQTP